MGDEYYRAMISTNWIEFSLLLLLGGFIGACSVDDTVESTGEFDPNYYPIKEGAYHVFRVDSIDYIKVGDDTVRYWIMEKQGGIQELLDGEEYRELAIYRKNRWEDEWKWIRTDLIRSDDKGVYRYQENIVYRPIHKPVREGKIWNAAPYNDMGFLYGNDISFSEATYDKVDFYDFVNNRGLDSTITVIQYEYYNIVDRFNFREKYANRVGPYKRVRMLANFQLPVGQEESNDTTLYIPYSGYKIIEKLVDYQIPKD